MLKSPFKCKIRASFIVPYEKEKVVETHGNTIHHFYKETLRLCCGFSTFAYIYLTQHFAMSNYSLCLYCRHLPGHGPMSISLYTFLSPSQGSPPLYGGGLLQCLIYFLVTTPHVAIGICSPVHSNADQLRSTEMLSSHKSPWLRIFTSVQKLVELVIYIQSQNIDHRYSVEISFTYKYYKIFLFHYMTI